MSLALEQAKYSALIIKRRNVIIVSRGFEQAPVTKEMAAFGRKKNQKGLK